MLCPNCESSNRDEARFCDQCGFPLTSMVGRAAKEGVCRGDASDASDGGSGSQYQERGSDALEDDDPKAVVEAVTDDSARSAEAECDNEHDYALNQPDSQEADDFDSRKDTASPSSIPEQQGCEGAALRDTAIADASTIRADGDADTEPAMPKIDLAGFDRPSDEFAECTVADLRSPANGAHDGGTLEMDHVEREAGHRGNVFFAPSASRDFKANKTIVAIVAAMVALVVITVFTTYQMGVWGGRPIPSVVGMTEADAKSVLIDSGFAARSQQVKSDDTEGIVIIMDPPAGTRAEEGSEVIVHISIGRTVPDVMGKSEADARKMLSEEGYGNIKVTKENSDKTAGSVIGVEPKSGTTAKSSTEVTLTIAQPFTVPDVSGMSQDEAIETLQNAGFTCDLTYINTDSYAPGAVMGTEPSAGSTVHKGDYILIQVSQSWSDLLVENAYAYLAEGSNVEFGGGSFVIDSVESVTYDGENAVSFTVTAHEVLDFMGHPIRLSPSETISGTLLFSEDGEVIDIT